MLCGHYRTDLEECRTSPHPNASKATRPRLLAFPHGRSTRSPVSNRCASSALSPPLYSFWFAYERSCFRRHPPLHLLHRLHRSKFPRRPPTPTRLCPWHKHRVSGENVPAILVRLPTGSAGSPTSYWAFSLNAPFGNCRLEYVTDVKKLRTDYDFHAAKHPMVGNPCSRTVYDPLKMMNIPGSVWVRGAIVQGSDLRPPLGIEVEIHDKQILAARME